MKVLFAFCVAWLLRCVYAFDFANRIEEWAGINYDPEDFKPGGSE